MIVRPERLRCAAVQYVIECEKNAENLMNVPETKAIILHVRTLPTWHYREIRISKLSSRNKSTDFNGTAVFMNKIGEPDGSEIEINSSPTRNPKENRNMLHSTFPSINWDKQHR